MITARPAQSKPNLNKTWQCKVDLKVNKQYMVPQTKDIQQCQTIKLEIYQKGKGYKQFHRVRC